MHVTTSRVLTGCAAALLAFEASATVQLSTGFEPPAYTTGNLIGQQGWVGFHTDIDPVTVQTGVVRTGTQAVKFDATVNNPDDVAAAWKPINQNVTTETQWTVQWDMRRDAAPANTGFGVGVYANNGNDWLGELGSFNNQGTQLVYFVANGANGPTLFGTNIPDPGPTNWGTYKIEMDYDMQTYRVSVNGVYFTQGGSPVDIPFMTPADTFSDADLTERFDPAGTAYFDNFSIVSSVVPEPASLGLASLTLLGLAARRRRA
jgi:hypothetical protein